MVESNDQGRSAPSINPNKPPEDSPLEIDGPGAFPGIYHETDRDRWWWQHQDGHWRSLPRIYLSWKMAEWHNKQVSNGKAINLGHSSRNKWVVEQIHALRECRGIDLAIPLHHCPEGISVVGSGSVALNTSRVKVLAAKDGDCSNLQALLGAMFPGDRELFYIYDCLKVLYEAWLEKKLVLIPPLMFGGLRGIGKSFLFKCLVARLGGFSSVVDIQRRVLGLSAFSGEWENSNIFYSSDLPRIRGVSANRVQDFLREQATELGVDIHPKGKTPYRAERTKLVVIEFNPGEEGDWVIPFMSHDGRDKVSLIAGLTEQRDYKQKYEAGGINIHRASYQDQLIRELPAFAYHLANYHHIPAERFGERFHPEPYQSPELLDLGRSQSQAGTLLEGLRAMKKNFDGLATGIPYTLKEELSALSLIGEDENAEKYLARAFGYRISTYAIGRFMTQLAREDNSPVTLIRLKDGTARYKIHWDKL